MRAVLIWTARIVFVPSHPDDKKRRKHSTQVDASETVFIESRPVCVAILHDLYGSLPAIFQYHMVWLQVMASGRSYSVVLYGCHPHPDYKQAFAVRLEYATQHHGKKIPGLAHCRILCYSYRILHLYSMLQTWIVKRITATAYKDTNVRGTDIGHPLHHRMVLRTV